MEDVRPLSSERGSGGKTEGFSFCILELDQVYPSSKTIRIVETQTRKIETLSNPILNY